MPTTNDPSIASRRSALRAALLAVPLVAPRRAEAQAVPSDAASAPRADPLFAVEFRVGPKWDATRKPHEQAHFREHSANLKRLRDAGALLLGARYADKGFVVLAAPSEAGARALVDADPSVQAQVFVYELHPFNVFYAGCVQVPRRA